MWASSLANSCQPLTAPNRVREVITASVTRVEAREPSGGDYERFFTAAFPHVARMARAIVGREGGEDVAIEALARAFSRWNRVQKLDNPQAWATRVATNLALDQVRRKRAYAEPSAEPNLEQAVTDREVLRSSVAKLPRRQRQVIALRFLADMPEDEVARILGVSTGSVKTHVHRALLALRVSLGTPEGGHFNVTET